MTLAHPPERHTQDRVVHLFTGSGSTGSGLGYRYLGDWTDRANNRQIEEGLLSAWLAKRGHAPEAVGAALKQLTEAANHPHRGLYANNQEVYKLLRYGVKVKTKLGAPTETVHLVDWDNPRANDFALAEEVTLQGGHERRPDLVLYVNGLALAVIELKNSRVSVGEGIRQLLSNQQPAFNAWFFSTVQLVFAGNDSEGLRYGTIETPEKYFLSWKEDADDDAGSKLDKYLAKLCAKERLLELIHDFVLFDGGIKKVPRPHQYFAVQEAQAFMRRKEGGIIWHTQGAGKSIVMVYLARWILEHNPQARVVVVTDRDELDKQIEGVFGSVGETIARSRSGRELLAQLAAPSPRLLCSLVHKFGPRDVEDFEGWLEAMQQAPPVTHGELFVFVDECHRTQSGRLHKAMKVLLPGAVFVGFTGTPLLKQDAKTSREVFGRYIHTYKFGEAVADGVVLDLLYEARDISQELGSQDRVDAWFEAKTRGLNDWQKQALKEKWGTMQAVLSSRSRMERVVEDIVLDFATRPRLQSERGTAMLVASSILEACRYYQLFQKTPLKDKCAVITSYDPKAGDVSKEEVGAHTETDKQIIYNLYTDLLKGVSAQPGKSKTETYEDEAKQAFIREPARMKLLIVVDKLLTGFDAPSCTYLYLDKAMQDHGLFQAICRTNRLDGEDKTFGHIVDYKDLFRKVNKAIGVYTSELAEEEHQQAPDIQLRDRLEKGREKLEAAREVLHLLCEPVPPPRDELAHIRHFCGDTEYSGDLAERGELRSQLYKAVAGMTRAYAELADDLGGAGYDAAAAKALEGDVHRAVQLRDTIRAASGERLDTKPYEADMRYLIDTYIRAEASRKISPFDQLPLLDLIVKSGMAAAVAGLPEGIRHDERAVAETIANNVRRKIIKDQLTDPAYFARMSTLLDEILANLKARRIEYARFLEEMAALAQRVAKGHDDSHAGELTTPGRRALFNNLPQIMAGFEAHEESPPYGDESADPWVRLALKVDAVVRQTRPDAWRGNTAKENQIKHALYNQIRDVEKVEAIFDIIRQQGEY